MCEQKENLIAGNHLIIKDKKLVSIFIYANNAS